MLPKVSITATDISEGMLDLCRTGIYDRPAIGSDLSPGRCRNFLDIGNDRVKVKDNIKHLVSFRSQNLVESYKLLGKFDVVFCRDVLICFSIDMKS
ncbi:chemotaxis protein methyltransferase [Candidatus Photodesmus blepharus]|uniref:Chemotaxis protein methyltransferase n=1 Tax=Candidatus Photodesmus blepharonis TaxID=1179155 RepID=A0A084CMF1_9GAMM|nr:chemotaxis protein methyltransferase [Candidatus Photodesmus blepharus]